MNKETIISLQAQQDVLLLLHDAFLATRAIDDEDLYRMQGALMALDCAIQTVKLFEGK